MNRPFFTITHVGEFKPLAFELTNPKASNEFVRDRLHQYYMGQSKVYSDMSSSFPDSKKDYSNWTKAVLETVALVEALNLKIVTGPCRKSEEINDPSDFYEADGTPFEIKTPREFSIESSIEAVTKELAGATHTDWKGDTKYLARVIIDTFFLGVKARQLLFAKEEVVNAIRDGRVAEINNALMNPVYK